MKIQTYILLLILSISGCKDAPGDAEKTEEIIVNVEQAIYPEAMQKVFEAHGGLKKWKEQRSLLFDIPKETGTESHRINLYSRKDIVETKAYKMGFDGRDVWLLDPDDRYKGDAVFYHNLMFYFYAMPFVLADDGIRYFETEPLVFEGKEYPGIGIGYNTGVGASPEDEYFIHYDPSNHQMAWLGYTVTYRTGEKSEDVHWIRYDNWTNIEGVVLPKSISWYTVEEGKVGQFRNTVMFENIQLGKEAFKEAIFAKPAGAVTKLPVKPAL